MSEIQDLYTKIHHLTVLLADDEEGVLTASGEFLKKFFDTVDLAINGKEALDMIRARGGYDIVITDLQMPVMNGFELIQEIKKEYTNIFIVIMSGNIEDESRLSGYCDVYLTKPTSFQSMIAMLKQISESKLV